MSNAEKPFEWMAWGGDTTPAEAQLSQMMVREGLKPEAKFFDPGKSQEMRFESLAVWVLVEGRAYFGIPGYGSIDMNPGDIIEINPGVFHDVTVTSTAEAKFLQSLRQ